MGLRDLRCPSWDYDFEWDHACRVGILRGPLDGGWDVMFWVELLKRASQIRHKSVSKVQAG